MRGSRVRVPLVALFSSASRACISLQKFFVCEISTSVVHGLPKPVRRVRLPYLAPSTKKRLSFLVPQSSYKLPHITPPRYPLKILHWKRKPLRTIFQVFRYKIPIFFIPLHQISATGDTQKVAEGVLGFDYISQYQLKRQYKLEGKKIT